MGLNAFFFLGYIFLLLLFVLHRILLRAFWMEKTISIFFSLFFLLLYFWGNKQYIVFILLISSKTWRKWMIKKLEKIFSHIGLLFSYLKKCYMRTILIILFNYLKMVIHIQVCLINRPIINLHVVKKKYNQYTL